MQIAYINYTKTKNIISDNMNELAWGTNNELNDKQFYNRVKDIKFISDLLKSSQYGTSPSILLTGIRGVGKSALMKSKVSFEDFASK